MTRTIGQIGLLTLILNCSAKDSVQTYPVPKDHPPITAAVGANIPPVRWTTPKDWQELPPTSVRLGNFLVPGKGDKSAEVVITSFPGSVGTELDNVNRWRAELGLRPTTQAGIFSIPVKMDAGEAKLYVLVGATRQTIVAVLPINEASWFFKLRGDKDVVVAARPAFLEFLKSVRLSGKAAETLSGDVMKSGAANPHVHVDQPASPHGTNHHAFLPSAGPIATGPQPQWNAPANWQEKPPGMMVRKMYSVANGQGQEAGIMISVFPGEVGGTLANVNRWRGPMGLPPARQEDLGSLTKSIDVLGGKGTLVEITATDVKTSKPARMIAAIVPHGTNTWFYKLVGDDALAAGEKAAFLKFVQTTRYP